MGYTFQLSLTIPKSTPASAPVNVSVRSGVPAIVAGRLTFPTGPAGLVYARLRTRSTPVYPVDLTYINADGATFDFSGYWRMEGPPWAVVLEGYNLDDTYPHTITALITCDSLQP